MLFANSMYSISTYYANEKNAFFLAAFSLTLSAGSMKTIPIKNGGIEHVQQVSQMMEDRKEVNW